MQGVEIVDQLWTDERPFALYKLPRSSSAHLLLGSSSSIERYRSVSDLPVKGGFVMAPFSPSDATPMIVLTPQEEHILPLTLSKESTKKRGGRAVFGSHERGLFGAVQPLHYSYKGGDCRKIGSGSATHTAVARAYNSFSGVARGDNALPGCLCLSLLQ